MPNTTSTWNGSNADWYTAGGADWTPTGDPGSSNDVVINSGNVTLQSGDPGVDVASISVAGGGLYVQDPGQTQAVIGNVALTGNSQLSLDGQNLNTPGGGGLTVGGTLTNSSTNGNGLDIGNVYMTAADTLTVNGASGLVNSSTSFINVVGAASVQATLNVANAAAGFGTLGVETGSVYLGGDALLEFKSGEIATVNGSLTLNGAKAQVDDSGTLSGNSALTGLATVAGGFYLESGASLATTAGTNLSITGNGQVSLDGQNLDTSGGGGLTIGGTLTNSSTNGNGLDVGNVYMTAADTLTVSGVGGLVNSNTSFINIVGANTVQSTLNVANAAAGFGTLGVETGSVYLGGDALLEFKSGGIATVNGALTLSGAKAQVDDFGALSGNSALTGLTTAAGSFYLENGASLATTAGTNLTISGNGQVSLDGQNLNSAGGGGLTIGGTLTNASTNGNGLDVGNVYMTAADTLTVNGAGGLVNSNTSFINIVGANTVQATLDVANAAAGFGTLEVETGSVYLGGDALLEFKSGGISTVNGSLTLNGAKAQVDDSGTLSGNSALTGLTTVAGDLYLENGASLATTAGTNLTIAGNGQLSLDGQNLYTAGGSSLSVGGTLTNSSTNGNGLDLGNVFMTAADTLTVNGAGGLVNSSTSFINLVGATTVQATLNVANAAAGFGALGVETGNVLLRGDALLEFESGGITTVNGALTLSGANAQVDDAGTLSGNSALTGLTTVAGAFYLESGASLATTAATNLTISGSGQASLDGQNIDSAGGSSLSVGGTLTNSSTNGNGLDVGNVYMTAADTLTVNGAGGLVNASTSFINVVGSATVLATLNVANAAAGFGTLGVETGSAYLGGDALLEFKSGEIATVNGSLTLNGAKAQVDDSGALSGNSALTGLATVAGSFYLENGASLATTAGTNLTISGNGQVSLDGQNLNTAGGGGLTVGGTLTNNSTNGNGLDVGNVYMTAAETLTVNGAGGVKNSGSINVQGGVGTAAATLASAGTVSTTGTLVIGSSGAPNSSVVTAPLVKVTGGLLEGVGRVNGAVDNTGGLVVGGLQNSTLTSLTINGSYSQTSGGELYADINTGASQTSSIVAIGGGTGAPNAAGSVNVAGGTLFVNGETSLALNTLYTVMTFATGSFYGTFSSVKTGGALGNATGAGTSVDLGNGETLEVVVNEASGLLQVEEVATAAATDYTWSAGSGTWSASSAANWNPPNDGTVPNSGSDVSIGAGGSGTVTLAQDVTVDSLAITAGYALNGGGFSATASGDASVAAGANLTLADLNVGGSLSIGGSATFSGVLTSLVGIIVNSGATLTLTGGTINDSTVSGAGAVNVAAGINGAFDNVTVSSATTSISIAAGGGLDLTGTNSLYSPVSGAGLLAIVGGSTTIHSGANLSVANLQVLGVSTVLTLGAVAPYAGNLTEGAGSTITLTSTNSLTLSGIDSLAGTIATAGGLAITGGHTTLNSGANLAVANLALTGASTTLSVAENLAFAGPLTENSGTISIASGDTLSLSGTDSLFGGVIGAGTLAITGGSTTIHSGVNLAVGHVSLSGAGTALTIGTIAAYAGNLTEGAGSTIALTSTNSLTLTGTDSLSGTLSAAGSLAITGGHTTLNSGAKLAVASVNVSGAATTLSVAETLSFAGPLTENSGTISIASGDTLSLSGTDSLSGGVIGAGTLAVTGGATTIHSAVNLAVGHVSISGAGTALTIGSIAAYAGNLTEGGGSTITLTSTNSLTLTGTDSLSGTLSAAGSLAITGGHTTLNSGAQIAVASVTVSGAATTLSVAENLSFAGPLTQNSGTLSIAGGDTLTLSGTDSLFGSVIGAGTLAIAGGDTTVHSGAVLSAADLLLSAAGATLTVGSVGYAGALTENSGTVSVLGTMSLTGTDSLSGVVSGTGKLAVAGGSTTIQSGANLTVSALSILGAATNVTLDENLAYAGAFSLAAGTLGLAAGGLSLSGADSFAGGTVNGANILLTEGASPTTVSGLTIGGSVEWQNTTTVNQSGQVYLGGSTGTAFLDNTATGVWDLIGNTGFSQGSAGTSNIVNAGLFEKTGGTGLGAVKPAISNTGTIEVSSGTMELKGAVTGTGADTISGAATFQFDSTVAARQTLGFTGSGGTLDLTAPQGFSGAITGFDLGGASNDAIDVSSPWSFTGAIEGASSTTLGFANGAINIVLTLQGHYAGTFAQAAITGGTQITYS